jgi:hypothetical protein
MTPTLYRYRCFCGQTGRGYKDGNLAVVFGERHVSDPKRKLGIGHTYRIYERTTEGTWRPT